MEDVVMAIGTTVRFPRYVKFGVDDMDGSEGVQGAATVSGSNLPNGPDK